MKKLPLLNRGSRRFLTEALALIVVSVLALVTSAQNPDPKKPAGPGKKTAVPLPIGIITAEMWKAAAAGPLTAQEIDQLIRRELVKFKTQPAARTSDEQFMRRVYLDLTGTLPTPAEIVAFKKDKAANKRARLIDTLLDAPEYVKHWSAYWVDVFAARNTDFFGAILRRHFDVWMSEQLQKNTSWENITRAILITEGEVRFTDPTRNGQAFFLASRKGADATTERAADTSRIFLGIQIQCAQCHDHPSDVWKREQFHQFAAYFGKLKERPIFEEKKVVGLTLFSAPFADYTMPSKENPKGKGTPVQPSFLDGKGIAGAPAGGFNPKKGPGADDLERRKALANAIVDPGNHWFAAAYVNRIWGELMGQSFYAPIDDLGPLKEAIFPTVLPRLAAGFRDSHYDMKELFRVLMNTETYQRQIRPGESVDEHLLFAAVYPARLRGDALYNSLTNVLGKFTPPGGPPPGKGGPFGGGLEALFKQEFKVDPSTKAEDVEGSVAQALLLMNHPAINGKIQAKGPNVLARILSTYPNDDHALQMVYLRTLARLPTQREMERLRSYVSRVGNRTEAFEDILWTLINSTEFQTKR